MKYQLFIVGLVVLVFLSAVFGFLSSRRSETTAPLSVPAGLPKLSEPAPPGQYKQPNDVTFAFASPVNFPAALPVYQYRAVDAASLYTIGEQVSSSLGLTATPTAIIKQSYTTRDWSFGDQASLTLAISDDFSSFTYRMSQAYSAQPTTDPQAGAGSFVSLFTKQLGLSFQLTDTTNGPFDGLLVLDTPRPLPNHGFIYSYTLNGYLLGIGVGSASGISVVTDNNGAVRYANITIPPIPTSQRGSVEILNTQQILQSLSAAHGEILNVNTSEMVAEPNVTPTFSSFQIMGSQLFYAPYNGLLLPAFIFSGVGKNMNSSTQNASFFLWAFPAGSSLPK